jgi:hypothetical protein
MSKSETKTMSVGEIFSQSDLVRAQELYPDARAICEQVIRPQLEEINRRVGQENDPMYLAYALVYLFDSLEVSSNVERGVS